MSGIITLTSDFGEHGPYVAAMKGVILGVAPQTQLVDVSHTIPPQNIFEAAFLLSAVYRSFPRSTVHLAVVDPAVGTDRRIIILRTPDGTFIGPDNGILSYVMRDYVRETGDAASGLKKAKLTADAHAVSVTNRRFFRHLVADTFHGRDIMAPVAAMLSKGFELAAFGEAADDLLMFDLPRPESLPDGTMIGHVVYIDRFGNVITDIREMDLITYERPRIEAAGWIIEGVGKTYADGRGLMALIGSSGYLEIAVPGGSAADLTDLLVSDTIKITGL